MTIASLAEVKAKFSAYIEACKTSPVVVTKNGKPGAFRTTSFGSVSKWDVLDYRRAPFLWEPATLIASP